MLATSRMWRCTRWMFAVWRRQLQVQVGAPVGDRRLRRPMPFQTTFPHEGFHHVRASSSQPIRRWPYLIRRSRAEAGALVVAAAAVARVAPVQVVVREVVVREAAVKAVRAEARAAEAREAALAVAVPILSLTITIRPTTSRGQSCRHFHLRLRPTNRSWRRWRKERAVSRFSTPTTCW